jgi:hypothetical protein
MFEGIPGLVLFFALAGYFIYNLIYMSRHTIFSFLDGLQMFFFQGVSDFYYWLKNKIAKK